jgi:hypothetical protein
MSLASFGAIAGGINQGMDMNRRDEQLKEQLETSRQNRQAMVDQNEYLKEQRERNRKQQGRDDQLTEDLANIPTPGQQKGVATDLGPDLKTQTQIDYAREQGAAYQRAGKSKEASELFRWANEADSKNAAQNWVQNLYSLPRNASLEEVVRVAGAGVDGDSSPVGVDHKNMRKNDDGSVTVRLYNKLTGASQERTFGSVGDLKEALTWHYAPDYARSLYEKRQAAQDKIDAERAKGVVVPAGATFVPGVGDSRGQYTNNNRLVWNGEYNPDGTPQMVDPRSAGGSASAVGAGKGGKIQDPLKAADDAWEFSSTKGEVKLQPNQLATGLRMTRAMAGDGVDPTLAAEVAMEVATDPTKARLELNTDTGTVDLIYRNPRVNGGRAIPVSKNAGTVKELESSTEGGAKAIKAQVQNMVGQVYGQNADRMIAIAADPSLSRQYLEAARERGMDTAAIANRLNLMRTYLAPAPARAAAPASQPTQTKPLLERLRTGFGINGASRGETDPNSPAGRFQARIAEAAKREEERKAQSSQASARLSEQFQNDAKTMDPLELVRKYDGQRMRLSTQDAAKLRSIEEQAFRNR